MKFGVVRMGMADKDRAGRLRLMRIEPQSNPGQKHSTLMEMHLKRGHRRKTLRRRAKWRQIAMLGEIYDDFTLNALPFIAHSHVCRPSRALETFRKELRCQSRFGDVNHDFARHLRRIEEGRARLT